MKKNLFRHLNHSKFEPNFQMNLDDNEIYSTQTNAHVKDAVAQWIATCCATYTFTLSLFLISIDTGDNIQQWSHTIVISFCSIRCSWFDTLFTFLSFVFWCASDLLRSLHIAIFYWALSITHTTETNHSVSFLLLFAICVWIGNSSAHHTNL